MDYLRTFAEEYGLKEIINRVAELPNVQGAVLTIDDLWLTAWKYKEIGRIEEFERLYTYYYGAGLIGYSPFIGINTSWFPQRPLDLSWRPPHWNHYSYNRLEQEDMLPVRLIVCLLPPSINENNENIGIPELPSVRLPVSFETRPLARLSTNHRTKVRPIVGGVSVGSVGSRLYGTLGGIVTDTNGVHYGMTCAHVFPSLTSVTQPALYDNSKATTIGKNTSSIALQPCPGIGLCNPDSEDPHITSVDTTLVELETNLNSDLEILSIGSLAGVVAKNTMMQGQEINFVGRTSGNRTAEIGGSVLFYRLNMDGKIYCFRNLFEIRWHSFLRSCLSPVVQAGDSGAWVCSETAQGAAWCGQVIGEDRHIGYATYAENIITTWKKEGKHLNVT